MRKQRIPMAVTIRLVIIAVLMLALIVSTNRPAFSMTIDVLAWATTRDTTSVTQDRQKVTALHEAGHLVVSAALRGMGSIHSAKVFTRVATDSDNTLYGESDTDVSIPQGSRSDAMNVAAVFYAGMMTESALLDRDSDSSGSDQKAASAAIFDRFENPETAEHGMAALQTDSELKSFMKDSTAAAACATATVYANAQVIRDLGDEIMRQPTYFNRRHMSEDELREFFTSHPITKASPACDF